jgi:predicted TIM-barrel fold metal-dependent hydrolase
VADLEEHLFGVGARLGRRAERREGLVELDRRPDHGDPAAGRVVDLGDVAVLPGTKIALSEGSIGWIPWCLERANQVLNTQKHWVAKGLQYQGSAEGAHHAINSGVDVHAIDVYGDYRRHFYGCFIDDMTGLRMLDVVGEDNVMIETDYPHSDTTWPHSIKLAQERLHGLPDDVQYKILRGNAERLYRFTPAEPLAKSV